MISTNFDPDMYAEGQILQLYRTSLFAMLDNDKNVTQWQASLRSNTANTFRDNFFWGHDSKIIETVEWADPFKTKLDYSDGLFGSI